MSPFGGYCGYASQGFMSWYGNADALIALIADSDAFCNCCVRPQDEGSLSACLTMAPAITAEVVVPPFFHSFPAYLHGHLRSGFLCEVGEMDVFGYSYAIFGCLVVAVDVFSRPPAVLPPNVLPTISDSFKKPVFIFSLSKCISIFRRD